MSSRTVGWEIPVQRIPSLFNLRRSKPQVFDSMRTLTGSTGSPPLPVRPRSSALTDLSLGGERFEALASQMAAATIVGQKLDGSG